MEFTYLLLPGDTRLQLQIPDIFFSVQARKPGIVTRLLLRLRGLTLVQLFILPPV